jgi:hypothetical protein
VPPSAASIREGLRIPGTWRQTFPCFDRNRLGRRSKCGRAAARRVRIASSGSGSRWPQKHLGPQHQQ